MRTKAVFGGLLVIGAVAALMTGGGNSAGTSGASSFTAAVDEARSADSSEVMNLSARLQSLTPVERLRMDELIHVRGFTFAHDSAVHRVSVDLRLDSIAELLKPRGGLAQGFPTLAQAMLVIPEPTTPGQARRAEALRQRASRQQIAAEREQQAQARRASEDAVIAQAGCTPSRAKVRRLLERHADWDQSVIATVACRKIRLGFTRDQVIAAWGRPYDVNRTTYSFGVHEQWVYGEYGGSYVYFEDGVVRTIQN